VGLSHGGGSKEDQREEEGSGYAFRAEWDYCRSQSSSVGLERGDRNFTNHALTSFSVYQTVSNLDFSHLRARGIEIRSSA